MVLIKKSQIKMSVLDKFHTADINDELKSKCIIEN
jgi:hypothetical protein